MMTKRLALPEINPKIPASDSFGALKMYCRAHGGGRRAAIVLHGGGYEMRSFGESEPVALELLRAGMQAFVLEYSLAPARWPQQLLELAATVAYIRENANDLRVDAGKITVYGFSAGAHLAGCLANHWHNEKLLSPLGLSPESCRPDALVLAYPPVTHMPPDRPFDYDTAKGVRALGFDPAGDCSVVTLDKNVSGKNPPAFIWHTFEDDMVPVEDSLSYARALRAAGVPFELHVYEKGPHAMGTCTAESAWREDGINPHAATWLPLSIEWLSEL